VVCLYQTWQRAVMCMYQTWQRAVMYLCVRGIDFVFLYDFSIAFWNCSDIVVFFVFCFPFCQNITVSPYDPTNVLGRNICSLKAITHT
jgi:Zn-dependent M28 family amino/carboxypeptidase